LIKNDVVFCFAVLAIRYWPLLKFTTGHESFGRTIYWL
jgi:hypothetical protein